LALTVASLLPLSMLLPMPLLLPLPVALPLALLLALALALLLLFALALALRVALLFSAKLRRACVFGSFCSQASQGSREHRSLGLQRRRTAAPSGPAVRKQGQQLQSRHRPLSLLLALHENGPLVNGGRLPGSLVNGGRLNWSVVPAAGAHRPMSSALARSRHVWAETSSTACGRPHR
jgi:hypothetical protein